MIIAVSGADQAEFPHLFEQSSRLRHQVFVEEMGWEDLRRADGREFDQFDDEHAVHHFCVRDGAVVGYQRMLPTTRPNLLSSVFPELCEGTPPSSDRIWELTRYCVATEHRDGRRGVSTAGSELIAGFVEWGMSSGIDNVIIEFEPMWVLRAMQLQFLARPLGFQRKIGNQQIVATQVTFGQRTIDAIRAFRGAHAPVLELWGRLGEAMPQALAV